MPQQRLQQPPSPPTSSANPEGEEKEKARVAEAINRRKRLTFRLAGERARRDNHFLGKAKA